MDLEKIPFYFITREAKYFFLRIYTCRRRCNIQFLANLLSEV